MHKVLEIKIQNMNLQQIKGVKEWLLRIISDSMESNFLFPDSSFLIPLSCCPFHLNAVLLKAAIKEAA
ncbi:hypothetical protein EO95_02780 [Methanosarcina sp. 1.H.T.1A.1]|nr:hypothetical protein EO95_02780 [Methanosarcina sp. 1.H.T.1A.1]